MTILISGATGFLGSYLVKHFIKEGHDVVVLKRSTSDTFRISEVLSKIKVYDSDQENMVNIFESNTIDVVINTVTEYGRKNKTISSMIEANLVFPIHLLELAIEHNVKTFINTDTLLGRDINAYALSKSQFVDWMRLLSDKIQMINIKIEHMYGPLDDENKFIQWFINQIKSNVDKIDLTSGIQKRDFIYIDDIISAYSIILQHLDAIQNFEEFELGTGTVVEVKAFLGLLYDELNARENMTTKLNFGAIPYRDKENMCMQANTTKLQKLGWSPKTTPLEGIKKTISGEQR